jgi:hypothetical protein
MASGGRCCMCKTSTGALGKGYTEHPLGSFYCSSCFERVFTHYLSLKIGDLAVKKGMKRDSKEFSKLVEILEEVPDYVLPNTVRE